ncbi:MAG: hypothetical protein DMG74_18360 [Acidobacteria bacterium]|nr:MAG: hypothetical protein DMG74_18360 [Acidobacteriota bacterium]
MDNQKFRLRLRPFRIVAHPPGEADGGNQVTPRKPTRKAKSRALVARKTDVVATGKTQVVVAKSVLQKFADEITRDYGLIMRATYIVYGQKLQKIKDAVGYGHFGELFIGHAHAVARPVPFDQRKAQMLMDISRNKVLSNPKNLSHLPLRWTVAHRLLKVLDPVLEQAFAAGKIHPGMHLHEVQYIRGVPLKPEPDPEAVDRQQEELIKDTIRSLWNRFKGKRGFLADFVRGLEAEEQRAVEETKRAEASSS